MSLRKFARFLFRLGICLSVLLLAALLLLGLPAVQQFVAQRGALWFSEKTGGQLTLGRFRLAFPHTLTIDDFLLKTPQGDTLAAFKHLRVETDCWALLAETVVLRTFQLEAPRIDLARQADSSWNYDFITRAFDDGEPPSDTNSTWKAEATGATLAMNNLRLHWRDALASSDMYLNLPRFEGLLDSLDLPNNRYHIQRLAFDGGGFHTADPTWPRLSKAALALEQLALELPDSAATLPGIFLKGRLVQASVRADGTTAETALELTQGQATFDLRPDAAKVQQLLLQLGQSSVKGDIQLQFDRDGLAWQALDLRQLRLAGTDLSALQRLTKQPDVFERAHGAVLELSARAQGSKARLDVARLEVKTGTQTQLILSGQVQNWQDPVRFFADLNLHRLDACPGDLSVWLPEGTLPPPITAADQLRLTGHLSGSSRAAVVRLAGSFARPQVGSAALGLSAEATLNPHPGRIALQLEELTAPKALVAALLPPDALPTGTALPDLMALEGSASGTFDSLAWQLRLRAGRAGTAASELHFAGQVRLNDRALSKGSPVEPSFSVQFGSHGLSKAELEGWLPADIKPMLRAPEMLPFKGSLSGTPNRFKADLDLNFQEKGSLHLNARRHGGDFEAQYAATDWVPAALLSDSLLAQLGMAPQQRLNLSGTARFDTTGRIMAQLKADSLLVLESTLRNLSAEGEGNYLKKQVQNAVFDVFFQKNWASEKANAQVRISGEIEKADWSDTMHLPAVLGRLALRQMDYRRDTLHLTPGDLSLDIQADTSENRLRFNSNWLTGAISGQFDPRALGSVLETFPQHYFALKRPEKSPPATLQIRDFVCHFPPFVDSLRLEARLDAAKQDATWDAQIRNLRVQTIKAEQIALKIRADSNRAQIGLRARQLQSTEGQLPAQVNLSATVRQDTAALDLVLADSLGKGRHRLRLNATPDGNSGGFTSRLAPDQTIDYQTWRVDPNNKITVHPVRGSVALENVLLRRDTQFLSLAGHSDQTLEAAFGHFDLGLVGSLLGRDSTWLGGSLDGKATVAMNKGQALTADLSGRGLAFAGMPLGQLRLAVSRGDTLGAPITRLNAALEGTNSRLSAQGHIFKDSLPDLDLQLAGFDVSPFQPLLRSYLGEFRGRLDGQVRVGGSLSSPSLEGFLQTNGLTFLPVQNGVRYRLPSEKFLFEKNKVVFQSVRLVDDKGQKTTLTGHIDLLDPANPRADLRLAAERFRLLNTQPSDTAFYYGSLAADFEGKLTGSLLAPDLSLSARPAEGSELFYKYDSGASTLDEGQGVVYFEKTPETEAGPAPPVVPAAEIPLSLSLGLDVNKNLLFKAIVDPASGDYFEGRGQGQLQYALAPDGAMRLSGRFEMVSGKYRYSYGKAIRRTFEVEPGSYMVWTGNAFTPDLHLKAKYRVLAPNAPFLGNSDSDEGKPNTRETFFVAVLVTGTLEKPEINFKIEYPTGEDGGESYGNSGNAAVAAGIERINSDPTRLTGEVFSLLAFNDFLGQSFGIVDVGASLNDLVTRQLNALTNDIRFVDIDFGWDRESLASTEGSGQRTNFSVNLRKSLFNDRLVIRFSGGAQRDERSLEDSGWSTGFQQLTAEYSLTPRGTWKIRLFSKRSRIPLFETERPVNHGTGLLFSKDFGG